MSHVMCTQYKQILTQVLYVGGEMGDFAYN